MTRHKSALILAAALSSGCSNHLQTEVLQPQVAHLEGAQAQIASTIVELVRDNGWVVQTYNPKAGWIIATEPVDRSAGFITRRRWQFSVRERGVTTQSFLDYWESGVWKTTFLVCEGYNYTQEKLMHAAIMQRLTPTELRHIATTTAATE